MKVKNCYQTLGLESNCTDEQIKSAFRKYAQHYHPDKHKDNPFFAEKFIEIKEAYDTLINYNTRKKHDEYHNISSESHDTQTTSFENDIENPYNEVILPDKQGCLWGLIIAFITLLFAYIKAVLK